MCLLNLKFSQFALGLAATNEFCTTLIMLDSLSLSRFVHFIVGEWGGGFNHTNLFLFSPLTTIYDNHNSGNFSEYKIKNNSFSLSFTLPFLLLFDIGVVALTVVVVVLHPLVKDQKKIRLHRYIYIFFIINKSEKRFNKKQKQ